MRRTACERRITDKLRNHAESLANLDRAVYRNSSASQFAKDTENASRSWENTHSGRYSARKVANTGVRTASRTANHAANIPTTNTPPITTANEPPRHIRARFRKVRSHRQQRAAGSECQTQN